MCGKLCNPLWDTPGVRTEREVFVRRWRRVVYGTAVALIAASCSPGTSDEPSRALVAQVASFDIAADLQQRFVVGLFAADRGEVTFGTVDLSFALLEDGAENIGPGPTEASFIPLPGSDTNGGAGPTFEAPVYARGVYGTKPISFDQPGFWEVTVNAVVDGTAFTATALFEVEPEPLVPIPGEPAPRTVQPLPGDPAVEPGAIESRTEFGGELPDPILHRMTIADAISAGRPVMVVIATPVFCVSQFCGPITDEVQRLAERHSDEVEFVHLEVWQDFEEFIVNPAALEWIAPKDQSEGAEPWVFLVDEDGIIVNRWDNVASVAELEEGLAELLSDQ